MKCNECNKEFSDLGKHLRVHGINSKIYYHKYILKTEEIPKCNAPNCFNEVTFRNIIKGYNKTCSRSCGTSFSLIKRFQIESYREKHSNRMIIQHKIPKNNIANKLRMKKLNDNPEFKAALSIRSKKLILEVHRDNFIKKATENGILEGIFYLMKFEDCIKIGVCRYSLNKLSYLNNRVGILKPISYTLYLGNLIEVANYEYKIKTTYLPIKGAEYFPLDMLTIIESEIPKTILPYSTQVG